MSIELLIAAIVAMSFQLSPEDARKHVEAATAAAHTHYAQLHLSEAATAQLFLGMSYIESRYTPLTLSRREPGRGGAYRRVTGVWTASTPPPGARPSWFCGPLQTGGNVPWETCQRMREDLVYGYTAGADELVTWYNDPACRTHTGEARLTCALHGYGGGYAAVRAGTQRYPANVLIAARRIEQLARFTARRNAPKS
jgi:hypothetical protein